MIWIKSCPKCRGDLVEIDDIYGKYVSCLQCGREMVAVKPDTSAWKIEAQDSLEDQAELVAA